jgi:hypothetical protein
MRLSVALTTSLLGPAHGLALVGREETAEAAKAVEAVEAVEAVQQLKGAACVLDSAIQMRAGPGDTYDYQRIPGGDATCPKGDGSLSASHICWYLKAISLKFDWLSHKPVSDTCEGDCYKYDKQAGRLYVRFPVLPSVGPD